MIVRKLNEIGSTIYRNICYPFVRIGIELTSRSIMKQGSFLNKGSALKGRNYIGRDTHLSNVTVGFGSYVNSRCDISNTVIGKYTSIGANVTTELGSHPTDGRHVALHPAFYKKAPSLGYSYADKDSYCDEKYVDECLGIQVFIGNDVWIGNNVSILEGVTIGDGAVVATGAVVTKDLEPYGIYAGVPAKKIKDRFDKDKIDSLISLKWWDKDEDEIKKLVKTGAFDDINGFLSEDEPVNEV